MKRILITGVSGFIGRSLSDFIEDRFNQYETYGIDISLKRPRRRHYEGDIKDIKFLKSILRKIKPHYIFHLVGKTGAEDFKSLVSANAVTTYYLLNTVMNLGNIRPRFIIPGSAAEYGDVPGKDMPVRENYQLNPVNLYGLSKIYQTALALSYCDKGLDVVVGRIFNISGPGTPPDFSLGKFAREISLIEKGKKTAVIKAGDLNSRRDFIDIRDICSAMIAIAEKGKRGEAYNICLGRSYKIQDMIDYLLSLSIVRKIKVCAQSRGQKREVKDIKGSNLKIKQDTKWQPGITIKKSLKDMLDYYRSLT